MKLTIVGNLAVFAFLAFFPPAMHGQSSDLTISDGSYDISLGPQKTLLRDKALGLRYFPDEGIVVLQSKPFCRLLLTAEKSSWLVEGASLEQLTVARQVAAPGSKGSVDNGYIGASAGWKAPDGSWYVACHIEDQENLPALAGGIPGFYARIALLHSVDGQNWEKLGPVISSQAPKEYTAYNGQGDRGTGEPGLCPSKDGKYLYLYYTEHSRVEGRGVQVCMARADLSLGAPGPGSFLKYYNGTFSEPGLGGKDSPVVAGRPGEAEAMDPHVVYSPTLNKYVMSFQLDYWKEFVERRGLKDSGIYLCFSDDAIFWSTPVKLLTDWCIPMIGKSLSWVPTLVFDEDISTQGWLLYGYSPSWGHSGKDTPHYLVGRRISIKVK